MAPGGQKVFDFLRHRLLHLHFHRDQLVMNPPLVNGRLDVFLQPEVMDDNLVLENAFSIQRTSSQSSQKQHLTLLQITIT